MAKFTPGPWIYCNNHVDDSYGLPLIRNARKFEDLNCADLRLISAAPDLYEACEEALANDMAAEGENASNMCPALRKKLEAALKRARGE